MDTIGEQRVRTNFFNPSNISAVDTIKQQSAKLINLVKELPKPDNSTNDGEFFRLQALAMTDYENAARWAVKAATFTAIVEVK